MFIILNLPFLLRPPPQYSNFTPPDLPGGQANSAVRSTTASQELHWRCCC